MNEYEAQVRAEDGDGVFYASYLPENPRDGRWGEYFIVEKSVMDTGVEVNLYYTRDMVKRGELRPGHVIAVQPVTFKQPLPFAWARPPFKWLKRKLRKLRQSE